MKAYVVKAESISLEERLLFLSLQGLVNKHEAVLFLEIDEYINYIKEYEIKYISLQEALNMFKKYYHGCITLDFYIGNIDINIASSLSAIFEALIIPNNFKHLIEEYQLKVLYDCTTLTGDYIDKQRYIFNLYKDRFNKDGLIHQVTLKNNCHITLRDYGISKKWFCFYTGEDDKAKEFRKEVLMWADKNICIHGWTSDEISFVADISKYGDYIIPMDWSCNHSFLSKQSKKEIKQKEFKEEILENKHYLTIVVSDGDNIQWLERDFAFTSTFADRIKDRRKFPISFTMAPAMYELSNAAIRYIYSLAENEYFVSGVSGAGYMNPCAFPKNYLPTFCNNTSKLMKMTDLSVVTLLDNKSNMVNVINTIDNYAIYDNIIGGIYEIDPSKYEGGKGEIYFSSNGKPFVSVRVSFWSKDGTNKTVTDEWIQEIADKINSFKIDKTSKEGYTVLNVHPWSTKIKDLNKLVSLLKEHVQIIKTDDFIRLIKENVKGV